MYFEIKNNNYHYSVLFYMQKTVALKAFKFINSFLKSKLSAPHFWLI